MNNTISFQYSNFRRWLCEPTMMRPFPRSLPFLLVRSWGVALFAGADYQPRANRAGTDTGEDVLVADTIRY